MSWITSENIAVVIIEDFFLRVFLVFQIFFKYGELIPDWRDVVRNTPTTCFSCEW